MGYGTLIGANTYHTDRGNAAWSGTDTVKNQALVRATDYIRNNYVARFMSGYDADNVANVEWATYEAALLELTTPGFFNKSYTESDRKVLIGLDSIKWQVVGNQSSDGSPFGLAPTSTKIEAYLWPYLNRNSGPWVV